MSAAPWILASRNLGKVRELRDIFAAEGIDVVDLAEAGIALRRDEEEAVEVHDTFEANALAKAWYYAGRAPGRTVVSDDSGLEVVGLGGAPGVRSRRWSGRADLEGAALDAANNALLVARTDAVDDRRARFVCAAAWCDGTASRVVRGELAGVIVAEARGAGGFGYDPHFLATELGCTLAEASAGEKERVGHRGRAFRALLGKGR